MVCHIVLTGTVVCEATRWSVTLFCEATRLGLLCVRPQDGLSHCTGTVVCEATRWSVTPDWDCCV